MLVKLIYRIEKNYCNVVSSNSIGIFLKKVYTILVFILTLLILSACSSSDQSEKSNLSPKICFIQFRLINQNNEIRVNQISRDLVDGKIKNNYNSDTMAVAGFLRFTILDQKMNVLKTFYLENPLSKMIEYVKADGSLDKKEVNKNEEDLSIRFQFDYKYSYIVIDLINDELKPICIFRNNLKFGEKDEN